MVSLLLVVVTLLPRQGSLVSLHTQVTVLPVTVCLHSGVLAGIFLTDFQCSWAYWFFTVVLFHYKRVTDLSVTGCLETDPILKPCFLTYFQYLWAYWFTKVVLFCYKCVTDLSVTGCLETGPFLRFCLHTSNRSNAHTIYIQNYKLQLSMVNSKLPLTLRWAKAIKTL